MLKTAKQNPCFDHNLYGSRINGKFSSCPLRQETYPGPLLRLEHRASGAIISLENLSWLRTLTSNAKKVTKVDKITPSAHWKPSHQATRDSIASPCAQITAADIVRYFILPARQILEFGGCSEAKIRYPDFRPPRCPAARKWRD